MHLLPPEHRLNGAWRSPFRFLLRPVTLCGGLPLCRSEGPKALWRSCLPHAGQHQGCGGAAPLRQAGFLCNPLKPPPSPPQHPCPQAVAGTAHTGRPLHMPVGHCLVLLRWFCHRSPHVILGGGGGGGGAVPRVLLSISWWGGLKPSQQQLLESQTQYLRSIPVIDLRYQCCGCPPARPLGPASPLASPPPPPPEFLAISMGESGFPCLDLKKRV